MKIIYAAACGIGAFFAMNCGSGDTTGYPSGSSSNAQQQQGAESGEAAQSSSSTDAVTTVKVAGHSFDPPEVRIKAGATVKWTWVSGSHNVVSGSSCTPDGKFTSGDGTVGPGATFERKFETAGTFPYYCDPHCGVGMTGKIIVE
jgi:plastocyanin